MISNSESIHAVKKEARQITGVCIPFTNLRRDCIAGNMREKHTLLGRPSKLAGWQKFALHSCTAIQLDGRIHAFIYVTVV